MKGNFWCKMMIWWPQKLWDITGYEFSQVWIETGSTDHRCFQGLCQTLLASKSHSVTNFFYISFF